MAGDSGRRLHLVCNAHLDPVWQWEWEEGAASALSTFRVAADLCESNPEFVFNHNEALLYEWVLEYEPPLFRRIQTLVAAGRWHIMGGWYLQPDCNMPSGESFVRQVLAGRRFFSRHFGTTPCTAINFDPFGHSRGLVQILRKSGYDSYVFCRPSQHDCPLPADTFRWVGFDGSSVMAARCPSYNSALGDAQGKVRQHISQHPGEACGILLWGVGDHGGGPSRQDVADLEALRAATGAPEVVHSRPEDYFRDLVSRDADLPVHAKDLNPWAVGCYSSMARVKQLHRRLENALFMVEKMATAAWRQGLMDYPVEEIASAERDLLICQFHDSLPGSSVQPVEESILHMLGHGIETLARVRARSFFALTSGCPCAADDCIPILVYNPHPSTVETTVECEFMLADQNWSDTFTDVDTFVGGLPVPCQVEKEHSNLSLDWRKRVVVTTSLNASAVTRIDCRLRRVESRPLRDGDTRLEFPMGEAVVRIGRETGLLEAILYRGQRVIHGAGQLLVVRDNEDPWGMTVRSFREVIDTFALLDRGAAARVSGVRSDLLEPVRVIESGPVRTVIEALFGCQGSVACVRYSIPKLGHEIGVEVRVHWNEKDRMLKLGIPLGGAGWRLVGQVAYGTAELPSNGDEAVAQRWVGAVNGARDLAVTCANDGTYACDLSDDGLRLTLLRSPAYTAHPIHDRPLVPQDRYSPRIDQGERIFGFWVSVGSCEERLSRIDEESAVHNEPPYALSFFPLGQGKASGPFIEVECGSVQMTALKPAETAKGVIVRLFEPTGKPATGVLRMPLWEWTVELHLTGFEIQTLLLDPDARSAVRIDLLEMPIESGGGELL